LNDELNKNREVIEALLERRRNEEKIYSYAESLGDPWNLVLDKYVRYSLPYAHAWQRMMTYPVDNEIDFERFKKAIYYSCFAGNQGGKSVWSAAWVIMECLGIHPLQTLGIRPKPPVHWWVVAPDLPAESKIEGGEDTALVKTFYEWCPNDKIKFYRKDKIMKIAESAVNWKSHDQDTKKFAGERLDGAMFDEVPPLRVWNECKPRIMKKHGIFLLGMTPDWGSNWTAEMVANEQENPDYFIRVVDSAQNPFMDKEYRERILDTMDEEERAMRGEGKHVQFMGLVLKHFSRSENVGKPFEITNNTYNVVICDWHPVKPIYITYLAINPRNTWYVWAESKVNDHIVDTVAHEIFSKLRLPDFNVNIKRYLIDAIASTQQVQDGKRKPKSIIDMFKTCGIRFIATKFGKNNDWANSAVEIDKRFKLRELYVDPSCINHIRQISTWGAKRYTKGNLEGTLRDMVEAEEDDTCVNLMYAQNEGLKFLDTAYEEIPYVWQPRSSTSRIYGGAR
jgi:phage terminase large subunit-like protein